MVREETSGLPEPLSEQVDFWGKLTSCFPFPFIPDIINTSTLFESEH